MPATLTRCLALLCLTLAHTAAGLDLFNEAAEAAAANEPPAMSYAAAKRAGFVGMRGKKDVEDFENNFENYLPEAPEEKRGKAMGFTGMRGKKDLFGLNTLTEDQWKMLGKGSSGQNELRYPVPMEAELRRSEEVGSKRGNSAFVGMRGKKSVDLEAVRRAEAELEAELEQLYAARALGKRAGFVGMRGKKRQGTRYSLKYRRGGGGSSGFVGMRG